MTRAAALLNLREARENLIAWEETAHYSAQNFELRKRAWECWRQAAMDFALADQPLSASVCP